MLINLSKLRVFLFSLVVVLAPFQDTILSKLPTGILTANLAFLPLLILCLLSLGKIKKLFINPVIFYYLVFFYSINIISVLYYNYYADFEIGFMLYKMVSMSILYFLYFFLAFITYDFLKNKDLRDKLKLLIFISLVITLAGALLNIMFPSIFYSNLFHAGVQNDLSRPRGFALEPSMLGYDALAIYLLFVTLTKSKNILWNIPIILIAVIVRSKGGILIIGVSYIMLQIVEICSSKILVVKNLIKIVLGLLILPVILFGFYSILLNSLLTDIEKFSSLATRSITFAVGVRSLMFPWGQGFSGFYPFFLGSAITISGYIQSIVPLNLKLTEIFSMVDNVSSIGTKTLLWDGTIIFGVPFFYLYIRYGILICKKFIKDNNLYCLLLAMITFLSGATFTSFVGYSYVSAICLGYLFYEYKKEDINCST